MKLVLVKRYGLEDIFFTKIKKVCEFDNYEDACEYLLNEQKKAKEEGKKTFITTDKKRKYYSLSINDLVDEYQSCNLKVETKWFFDYMLSKKCC